MNEWLQLVLQRIGIVLEAIPEGTCVQPTYPLTYTAIDERMMHDFLSDKVCTSMDKGAGTIMFNCQKDHVNRIDNDLSSNSLYVATSLTRDEIAQQSNDFGSRYGFAPNPTIQKVPYYKGLDKMHKVPNPETRFISSSAKSHLKRVSLFLTYVVNAIMLETDTLFGNEMKVTGVTANWAARSWMIKSTAENIPLLRIWNTQYAQHSPSPPPLASCDFARLYTKHSDIRYEVSDHGTGNTCLCT